MAGKPKAENGVTIVASPARKTLSNKRVFGTELTNIGINRSKLEPTIQKKAKLAQGGADILKSYNVAAQKQPGQVNKSGFVYGPFHPSCARKQEPDECNKVGQKAIAHDWESLADSFRPQYQNPGWYLSALFGLVLFLSRKLLTFLDDEKSITLSLQMLISDRKKLVI